MMLSNRKTENNRIENESRQMRPSVKERRRTSFCGAVNRKADCCCGSCFASSAGFSGATSVAMTANGPWAGPSTRSPAFSQSDRPRSVDECQGLSSRRDCRSRLQGGDNSLPDANNPLSVPMLTDPKSIQTRPGPHRLKRIKGCKASWLFFPFQASSNSCWNHSNGVHQWNCGVVSNLNF